jgi:hypothetical protein
MTTAIVDSVGLVGISACNNNSAKQKIKITKSTPSAASETLGG